MPGRGDGNDQSPGCGQYDKAIQRKKTARGAHYALKLKANNAPLFNCALAAFAAADAGGTLKSYEESDRGHDRDVLHARHVRAERNPAD